MVCQLLKEDILLQIVNLLHRLEQLHLIANTFSHADQRTDVLGETTAAVAAAGVKETASDAGVAAHTPSHHVHVGPHQLAEVGNIVHKTDAGGQHRI